MNSRDKTIQTARNYADQGRYSLAIREYERLVSAHPDDQRSRVKLGVLHVRNGAPQTAIELWLEAAHAYEQRGAKAEVAVVLQQVLQLDPDHVDALGWLAQVFVSLGQPAESRRALEVAHALLEQRGRMFEALRVLEDMVALDPGNVALCIRLGEAYVAGGRKEDAALTLTRAVDVLRVAEWVDDFIRVAERLVWLQPDNLALSKELATHYLCQRDPQSALQKLKCCYEADQSDPDTLKLLADTFIDLREPEKAATILRVLAEVFEQRGEPKHADAVLDQADRLDPKFQSQETEASTVSDRAGTDPRAVQPDPTVMQMEEGDWTWQPPVAVNAGDLSPLEMSLQPDGPEEDAPRRFLPAITAEGRHGRGGGSGVCHRTVTTQELDLSDLIFLEQQRTATTEDLAPDDLEEETDRRPDLSTHEKALNELEDLACELSERYLGSKSQSARVSREKETVRYRHSPPRHRTEPQTHPDGRVADTRRSPRPEGLAADSTEPRGRRGQRSRS